MEQVKILPFKTNVTRMMSSLNVITHCKVSWEPDRSKIYIRHDRNFCPDFEMKFSEQYGVYHVYILIKARDTDEKVLAGYTIMVVDSGCAAAELNSMIQMLYRRRPGQRA